MLACSGSGEHAHALCVCVYPVPGRRDGRRVEEGQRKKDRVRLVFRLALMNLYQKLWAPTGGTCYYTFFRYNFALYSVLCGFFPQWDIVKIDSV